MKDAKQRTLPAAGSQPAIKTPGSVKTAGWIGAVLLVFSIMLAVFPAFAESAEEGGFTYEIMEDGTACITGCSIWGDVVIPSVLGGHTVTKLAEELFYGSYDLTYVRIPATVIHLGDNSDNSFAYVFSYCRYLTRIDVDPDNPVFTSVDGVLYSKDMVTLFNYPCAKEDSEYHVAAGTEVLDCTSFASARYLDDLYLEGYDTIWRGYTFYNCGNMTVHYHTGGQTGSKVVLHYSMHHCFEYDSHWPSFAEYGDPKPDPIAPEGELGYVRNLKVGKVPEGLKLTWDAAPYADNYAVYRQINNQLVPANPYALTAENSYIDSDIEYTGPDYVYQYWIQVRQVNASGDVINWRNSKSVYYMSFPVISSLMAETDEDSTVTLTWENVDNITGYEVYYSVTGQIPGLKQEPILRVTENSAVIDNLAGGIYTFFVRPYYRLLGDYDILMMHEDWSSGVSAIVSGAAPDLQFVLPSSLKVLETGAFVNIAADAVFIPRSVTSISGNPFADSSVRIIAGYPGTAAESFASAYGYLFYPIADE